jgi:catechol-2,3-dioxygenase
VLERMMAKGKKFGIETRGVSDHGFVHSIYLRDPNGYVIELTAKTAEEHEELDPARARKVLDEWQASKPA